TLDWTDTTETGPSKMQWNASTGAIFLANIDDDQQACPIVQSNTMLSDVALASCNDAQDTIVNGDDDLLDLAPIGVGQWATAPAGTTATVTADGASAPYVHLFIMRGGQMTFFDWQNG